VAASSDPRSGLAVTAPVWLVLLGTFVAGTLVGWLLRRRQART